MVTKLFDSTIAGGTAQEALDFITNILESSTEYSIIGKDLQGKIVLWNEGARRLYGYAPDEVVGKVNWEILHPAGYIAAGRPRELLAQALRDGKREGNLVRVRKNGSQFTAHVVITPRRDNAGHPIGFLLISKDITEETRLTKDLESFAFLATHDLQEPLRNILVLLQLHASRYGTLADRSVKERDLLDIVMNSARQMQALLADIIIFSHASAPLEASAPVAGEEILRHAVTHLKDDFEETGAEITHDTLPVIVAKELLLIQVFQNLLGNAIKFRDKNPPRVHVGTRREERGWVFWIKDNGTGIDPMQRDKLFLPFYRLHNRREHPGNGVGLATCKRIIERHGGQIWVESEPGKGATFYFTIPDSDPDQESERD